MPSTHKPAARLTRREFVKLMGGLAASGLALLILRPQPAFSSVLPPGAVLPANRFRALCQRCGKCVAICTRRAIRQNAEGLPFIDGLSGWCDFCMDCARVCPTGAIQMVEPKQAKLGVAVIEREQCLAWKWIGCRLCYEKCAGLQKAIELDGDFQVYVLSDRCNGCGACVNVCPQPDGVRQNKNLGRAVALRAGDDESGS